MKKLIFILIVLFSVCYSNILPNNFALSSLNRSSITLPSNSVVDIREGINGKLYLGTSEGLGYADITDPLSPIFYTVEDYSLPVGGVPALKTYSINANSFMVVLSGAVSTFEEADGKWHPRGSGISWSFDDGLSWHYIQQPVDDGVPGGDIYFEWYGQQLKQKVWHTTVDNVSYDVAADTSRHFIYSTSWAGGLRRFNYTDENPEWEVIPLPMDARDSLICSAINENEYYLNPLDPPIGSHNHKAFSVYSDEDTLWVGTADGINKGIVQGNGCINWSHFNTNNGLGGDWIVGIIPQQFETYTRLWLVSWITAGNPHPLTYTDNGGENWNVVSQLFEMGILVYDLSFSSNYIIASTDHGVYYSIINDGNFWIKMTSPFKNSEIEDSLVVFTSIMPFADENALWIGTNVGVARSYNWGIDWEEFSFDLGLEDYQSPLIYNLINIYPNPFNPTTTISFSIPEFGLATITVYDLTGRKLETLTNEVLSIGNYSINWNASYYPSGVYLIRMDSGEFTQTQKVVLIK